MNISEGTYFQHDTAEDVLKAAVATGHEVYADVQDLHKDIRGLKGVGVFSVSIRSYSHKFPLLTCLQKWAKYISPDGKRQDAAHTYIHPLMQSGDYPNLHLLVNSKVSRVLFDENKHATGVEYVPSATSEPVTGVKTNQTFTVTAKRMVVVASGAL